MALPILEGASAARTVPLPALHDLDGLLPPHISAAILGPRLVHTTDLLLCVGGAETVDGAGAPKYLSISAPGVQAAGYSDRGKDYPKKNEDGFALGTDFGVVADEAGGMGHVEGVTGAASAIAVEAFRRAREAVARGVDPRVALRTATEEAHRELKELNRTSGKKHVVTTLTGWIRKGNLLYVLNVGDSQALLISKEGKVKNETTPHTQGEALYAKCPNAPDVAIAWNENGVSMANILTQAVGSREIQPEILVWVLRPGDTVIVYSDGVGDAYLKAQQKDPSGFRREYGKRSNGEVTRDMLGQIVSRARNAVEAVKHSIGFGKNQVEKGEGKLDNITLIATRVEDGASVLEAVLRRLFQ
jgi:serine/threonine protein phosphatase PrpC